MNISQVHSFEQKGDKISVYFFLFVLSILLSITACLFISPEMYHFLSKEDNLVESFGAISMALTSLFLFLSFRNSTNENTLKSAMLIACALVFLVGAGEEISWGQRIFGWDTPDALGEVNQQNETNFHNMNSGFFNILVYRSNVLFVLVATVFVFLKQHEVLDVAMPKISTICIFAIPPFYQSGQEFSFHFSHLQYLALFPLIYYLLKKERGVETVIPIVTVVAVVSIEAIHVKFSYLFSFPDNTAAEYREFLFALACLFYAYYIFYMEKKRRSVNVTPK